MVACPKHPEKPLDVVCERCGDFTCALCVEPLGKSICPACVERLVGAPKSLRRIKLDHWDAHAERFPHVCPNCLGAPTNATIRLGRGDGMLWWPHCERCVRDERRVFWWRQGVSLAAVTGVASAVASPFVLDSYHLYTQQRATFLAFACVSLIPIAYALYFVARRRAIPRVGAVAFGSGIKLRRYGHHLLSRGYVLEADLLNEDYATLFLALNAEFVARG